MKLKPLQTISFKVGIIYLTLAIITTGFFITIIFENQVDLITDSSKLKAEKLINSIIPSLNKFASDFKSGKIFIAKNENDTIEQINLIIKPLIKDYIIYNESGIIQIKSHEEVKLPDSYILDGAKSITDQDFTGKQYYLKIDEKDYVMNFFIPLKNYNLKKSILFVTYNIGDVGNYMSQLYRQVAIIIIVISLFHVIFAVLMFIVFVKPVQSLNKGSYEISIGNYDIHIKVEREDELGMLANSFNKMASSIKEQVVMLNASRDEMEAIAEHTDEINKELTDVQRIHDQDMKMAINVQSSFYTSVPPVTECWDTAYEFVPASGVSGDLYDFYKARDELSGVSLFDVSGHGIASGLITMLAKNIISKGFNYFKSSSLNRVLEMINNDLISQIDNVDNYLTGIIIRFYGDTVEYVNAGHTDLLFKDESANTVSIIGEKYDDFKGPFLGISMMAQEYEAIKFNVSKNKLILLYSDCLIESKNSDGEPYGMENLIESFKNAPANVSAKETLNCIMKDFYDFIGEENKNKLNDDLTVILLRRKK